MAHKQHAEKVVTTSTAAPPSPPIVEQPIAARGSLLFRDFSISFTASFG